MTLNKKQEKCLWIGIIVFILMCLFPPWYYSHVIGAKTYGLAGYGFLLLPPSFSTGVNLTRLILQLIMVGVITAWAVYLRKDKPPESAKK